MKQLQYLLIFLSISSCTHQRTQSSISGEPKGKILFALTPEEEKMHQCLKESSEMKMKNECLKGSIYENYLLRTPSSAQQLLDSNGWFFYSEYKIELFLRITKGIIKAQKDYLRETTKKLIHNMGVAFNAEVYLGYGQGHLFELINHNQNLGMFCAPYKIITTDIGSSAGIGLVRSVSCKTNADYVGGFLTFGAGLSGELIGLPVDMKLAYSFGLDSPKFFNSINKYRQQGELNYLKLANELSSIQTKRPFNRSIAGYKNLNSIFDFGLSTLSFLNIKSSSVFKSSPALIKSVLVDHVSLGQKFKELYTHPEMREFFSANDLPNLKLIFSILAESFTGCDSIGGAASLSLSASPVALSASLNNYHLLIEMPHSALNVLSEIRPFQLLNPILINPNDLISIVKVARDLSRIPSNIRNKCGDFGI